MKTSAFFSIGFLLVSANAFAQPALGTINSTANTVNSAAAGVANVNSAVSNTGSAIKNTAETLKGVSSMFKKKEKPAEPVKEVATNAIVITIVGIDYSKLKALEDAIKPIAGVTSTLKKFSTAGSTIEVNYSGKDDQLWDALPESAKAAFTLTDLGSGKITLEQKK